MRSDENGIFIIALLAPVCSEGRQPVCPPRIHRVVERLTRRVCVRHTMNSWSASCLRIFPSTDFGTRQKRRLPLHGIG